MTGYFARFSLIECTIEVAIPRAKTSDSAHRAMLKIKKISDENPGKIPEVSLWKVDASGRLEKVELPSFNL